MNIVDSMREIENSRINRYPNHHNKILFNRKVMQYLLNKYIKTVLKETAILN